MQAAVDVSTGPADRAASPAPLRSRLSRQRWSTAGVVAAAVLTAAPIVAVIASIFADAGGAQAHIWSTTGPRYLAGTVFLVVFVAAGAGLIGFTAGALTALCDFPGRRIVAFALALPLAAPAYVIAYAYGDFFAPFGAGARALAAAGFAPLDIKTRVGAGVVLTLATYPYVYLAVRAALSGRSGRVLEAARSLGAGPFGAFRRVLAPAARPALAGGLALSLMETVGDFGVADYFGAPTLSTGIFRTWHGMGDLNAAAQLAAALFIAAGFLVLLEAIGRRGRVDDGARGALKATRFHLKPLGAATALILCAVPPLLGFVAPLVILVDLIVSGGDGAPGAARAGLVTASLAAAGTALALILAIILGASAARGGRAHPRSLLLQPLVGLATLGYALPGALVAIGVLRAVSAAPGDLGARLIAGGGGALLLYAYTVRFLTAAYNAFAGGLARVSPAMADASRALGVGGAGLAIRVYAPLTAPSLAAGAVIVFIDIAKELPATLILRPFNLDTLATRTYHLASDERLAEAAPEALALIALGVAPVLILNALAGRLGGR